MGRTLKQVLAALPARERSRVNARYEHLRADIEGLRQLREIATRSQAEIAKALGIKQPSVSKMERQTDLYLSTLRNFIEASGGALELTVRFPDRPAMRLARLGPSRPRPTKPNARTRKTRGAKGDATRFPIVGAGGKMQKKAASP